MKKRKSYLVALLALIGLIGCTYEETAQEREALFTSRKDLKIVMPGLGPNTYSSIQEYEYGSHNDNVVLYFFDLDGNLLSTLNFRRNMGNPDQGTSWSYNIPAARLPQTSSPVRLVVLVFPESLSYPDSNDLAEINRSNYEVLCDYKLETGESILELPLIMGTTSLGVTIDDINQPGTVNIELSRRASKIQFLQATGNQEKTEIIEARVVNGSKETLLFGQTVGSREDGVDIRNAEMLYGTTKNVIYINPTEAGNSAADIQLLLKSESGNYYTTTIKNLPKTQLKPNTLYTYRYSVWDGTVAVDLEPEPWTTEDDIETALEGVTHLLTVDGSEMGDTYITNERKVSVTYTGNEPTELGEGITFTQTGWGKGIIESTDERTLTIGNKTIQWVAPATPPGFSQSEIVDLEGTQYWVSTSWYRLGEMEPETADGVSYEWDNRDPCPLGYRLPIHNEMKALFETIDARDTEGEYRWYEYENSPFTLPGSGTGWMNPSFVANYTTLDRQIVRYWGYVAEGTLNQNNPNNTVLVRTSTVGNIVMAGFRKRGAYDYTAKMRLIIVKK